MNVGKQRPLVIPLEVTFKSSKVSRKRLVVDGSVPWAGVNFCS
jgi:hypothetical protein